MFLRFFLFIGLLAASLNFVPAAHAAPAFDKVMQEKSVHCGTFVFNNLYEPAMKPGEAPKGFFADVMNEVGARLKIKVSFAEVGSFGTAYDELKNGRYDMLCASFASFAANYSKRLFSEVLFYDPLYPYGDAKKDYSAIKSREDINNPRWRIAGMDGELGGYFGPIVFPKAKMHMVSQFSTAGGMMNDLFANKADMVLITNGAAKAYEKTNPGALKRLLEEPIALYPIRFIFRPEDMRFKIVFDQVIEDMKAEGVIERLKKRNGIQ